MGNVSTYFLLMQTIVKANVHLHAMPLYLL